MVFTSTLFPTQDAVILECKKCPWAIRYYALGARDSTKVTSWDCKQRFMVDGYCKVDEILGGA